MAKKSQLVKVKRLKKKSKFSTRPYNRCEICGRSGGYIRMFGMCRICFRKHAHQGLLPGVVKASW